jgi:hypothetical protein
MQTYHIVVSIIYDHDMYGYPTDEGLWSTLSTDDQNKVLELSIKMYDKMISNSLGRSYRDPQMIISLIDHIDYASDNVFLKQIYFSTDRCKSIFDFNYDVEIIEVEHWCMIGLSEYFDEIGLSNIITPDTNNGNEYCQMDECSGYATNESFFCRDCE